MKSRKTELRSLPSKHSFSDTSLITTDYYERGKNSPKLERNRSASAASIQRFSSSEYLNNAEVKAYSSETLNLFKARLKELSPNIVADASASGLMIDESVLRGYLGSSDGKISPLDASSDGSNRRNAYRGKCAAMLLSSCIQWRLENEVARMSKDSLLIVSLFVYLDTF